MLRERCDGHVHKVAVEDCNVHEICEERRNLVNKRSSESGHAPRQQSICDEKGQWGDDEIELRDGHVTNSTKNHPRGDVGVDDANSGTDKEGVTVQNAHRRHDHPNEPQCKLEHKGRNLGQWMSLALNVLVSRAII